MYFVSTQNLWKFFISAMQIERMELDSRLRGNDKKENIKIPYFLQPETKGVKKIFAMKR
jgi:hypothetical protein